jgi:hypothetical protein
VTKLDRPGVVHLQNGSQVKFDTLKLDNVDIAPGIQILNKTNHIVTSF